MKFHFGDRVELIDDRVGNYELKMGDQGTVVGYWGSAIHEPDPVVRVDWDKPLEMGHSSDGHARAEHGWNVRESNLEFVIFAVEDIADNIDISSLL